MGLPFFNMYVGDFEADTAHLTLEEDGAYNRLLRLCWRSQGCTVPNDKAWLMRRLRVDEETYERAVAPVIDEFFEAKSGRLFNPRLLKEFAQAKDKHEKRVSAGKSGGFAKAQKTKEIRSSNAKAKPKQCSGNQNQNQNQNQKEDRDFVSCQPAADPTPASEVAEAVAAYNNAAKEIGWPQVQKMNQTRTKALRARIADAGGIDGWDHAINRAVASDFLSGRDGRWSGFSFDWVTKSANFTKLMEGNYDNRDRQSGHPNTGARRAGGGTADAFATVAQEFARGSGGG